MVSGGGSSETVERKLRQIYDAFDNRNYKLALKLATAGAQKHPESHMMRALRAVGLERTGRADEAVQAADEVLATAPPDESVLSTLAYALRPSGQLGRLTAAYERLAGGGGAGAAATPAGGGRGGGGSAAPVSEELLEGLFACYVREARLDLQQRTAVRLQKAYPSELHQWWVVDSIVLQAAAAADADADAAARPGGAIAGSDPAGATLGAAQLLQLAESMAARLIADRGGGANNNNNSGGGAPGPEALELYLGVLAARGRARAAADALDGPAGAALRIAAERRQARAALLLAAARGLGGAGSSSSSSGGGDGGSSDSDKAAAAAEAAALYRSALAEQPDDWSSLLLYLDARLPPACASGHAPPASCWDVARALSGRSSGASDASGDASDGGYISSSGSSDSGTAVAADVAAALAEAAEVVESLPAEALSAAAAQEPPSSSANAGAAAAASSAAPQILRPKVHGVLRGPALARVELARRRVALGAAPPRAVAEAALACHERLGHMLSCAMDLRPYVTALPPNEAEWLSRALAERLKGLAAAAEDEAAAAAATDGRPSREAAALLRRRVSALQLQEELRDAWRPAADDGDGGAAAAAAAAAAAESSTAGGSGCPHAARAAELAELFADAAPLWRGLDGRERGPADELPPLAANALARGAHEAARSITAAAPSTPSDAISVRAQRARAAVEPLLMAVLALEAAACGRAHSPECHLGLTSLYGLLGCAPAAAAHFAKTDAKHIQLDTLASHHLLPALLAVGAADAARPLLAQTRALFDDHLRDAGDTLMQAYRHGTHTKVLEFALFKRRLERAHTYALARAEAALLAVRAALAGGGSGSGSGGGSGSSGGSSSGAEAAAAAAAGLPLTELDGRAWRGMRFNADLQTRPPWLPPAACAAHAAVLRWWDTAAAGAPRPGVWWRRVGAAECALAPARRLRAAQREGLAARWLLPHLLAAALAPGAAAAGGASAADAGKEPAALQLAALVKRFAAALGVVPSENSSGGGDDGINAAIESALACADDAPASRKLELLDLAVFHTAEAAVRFISLYQPQQQQQADPAAALEAAAADLSRRGQVLAAALAALEAEAAAALAPSAAARGLLPGSALSLASLLVDGGCLWAVACLESWTRALKAAAKRKSAAKKAAAPEGDEEAALRQAQLERALKALAGAGAAAAKLLGSIAAAAKALPTALPADAAEAELLAVMDPSGGGLAARLAGYEPQLSAAHVARGLLSGQRGLLARVGAAAAALQARAVAAV